MAIILRLDRVMADRKINLKDLSEQIGIANVNLSKIKTGKVSAIRFSTLNAICKALDCQPGDILEYQEDEENGISYFKRNVNKSKKRWICSRSIQRREYGDGEGNHPGS